MSAVRPLVTVAIAVVVGGAATFAAVNLVSDARSYVYATVTAVFGAVVWGVVVLLLAEGTPGRQLVPLVGWIALVKWRYRETWPRAAGVGFSAWVAVFGVLTSLSG